jgi:hypothetical protein
VDSTSTTSTLIQLTTTSPGITVFQPSLTTAYTPTTTTLTSTVSTQTVTTSSAPKRLRARADHERRDVEATALSVYSDDIISIACSCAHHARGLVLR